MRNWHLRLQSHLFNGAIADPELAPYGVAAQSVLIGTYGLAPPLSSNSQVHEYPNITAAYNAVIAQTDPVGFVAMSAICLNGKYPTSGTSALAYFPVQASSENPSMLTNSYSPLTQAGIPIRQRRSEAQNDELSSFVAFLTDFTSPPTPDPPMTATLKKYLLQRPLNSPDASSTQRHATDLRQRSPIDHLAFAEARCAVWTLW